MPDRQALPDDTGYQNVAVCLTDDPSWTPSSWDDVSALELDSTHLVRVDELLVPTDAGEPAAETWEPTGTGVAGIALYRRRVSADQSASAPAGDGTPPSGAPVMTAVGPNRPFAPNAVFCSQGLRATVEEAIGPFKVAPRYQGLGGAGPQPVPETLDPSAATRERITALGDARRIAVAVIDTGIGQGRYRSRRVEPFVAARCLVSVDTEDHPDFDMDERLDAVAGHGTFVAGEIAEAEPQVMIEVIRAVDKQGAVNDLELAKAIDTLCELQGRAPEILNLSLAGRTHDNEEPLAVAARLRDLHRQGTAIVAAAGNLGSAKKFWPAAMEEVIGVGAVTRSDRGWVPTEYSNRGSWIKAAVEAHAVVGAFYENFTSKPDPDDPQSPSLTFEGRAQWDGTSFLAPHVAGRLCQLMIHEDLCPHAAWERLASGASEPSPREMKNAVVITREPLAS